MSKIALSGDAAGTGTFTIASPNSNSNFTLTLPAASGTAVVAGSSIALTTLDVGAGSASTPSLTFTGDTNTGIYSPGADRIGFTEGGTQVGEFDASGNFLFNSGYGSAAIAYGCRAWVNFNGTGTVATRGSGNVSSISDNGTGTYTVNFTNALSDANYSVVATTNRTSAVNGTILNIDSGTTPTTSAVRLITFRVTTGIFDTEFNCVSIDR